MDANAEEVLHSVLALPEADRLEIIEALIDASETAGPALDEAWIVEIKRRSNEIDAGGITFLPWSEVKERARAGA